MEVQDFGFPPPLLDALQDQRLVVFAGAGVSMGKPAELPSFRKLTKKIAQSGSALHHPYPFIARLFNRLFWGRGGSPGVPKQKPNETDDEFLGRLETDYKIPVREEAVKILSRQGLKHNKLHRNLPYLFHENGPVRIVTTNFDCLFEQAAEAESLFENPPDISKTPALPPVSLFQGIAHLHGSIHESKEMVLARSDFGRAYLTEADGWARRFVVDLFDNYTILFVGYSHRDTIMKYLTSSLPKDGTEKFLHLLVARALIFIIGATWALNLLYFLRKTKTTSVV